MSDFSKRLMSNKDNDTLWRAGREIEDLEAKLETMRFEKCDLERAIGNFFFQMNVDGRETGFYVHNPHLTNVKTTVEIMERFPATIKEHILSLKKKDTTSEVTKA